VPGQSEVASRVVALERPRVTGELGCEIRLSWQARAFICSPRSNHRRMTMASGELPVFNSQQQSHLLQIHRRGAGRM
jgi:hypothetical protein